ncbi:MAG: GNAT family N-acetyltransferase [Armatimonadetes bacterium]|nr:GNAT family N-acetyltransferase [Armatimonadota bacterium]MDE2205096.1 GNAT family N-acetyltransferase [Armatimonadota bacterium]
MPPSVQEPPRYSVVAATSAEDRAQAFDVRVTVFVVEQLVPQEEELDAWDDTAYHFLALFHSSGAQEAVGAARLVVLAGGAGKIGRVAVLRRHRRHGVGRLLMAAVEAQARRLGIKSTKLDAQLHAIPFYEALGYSAEGPVFLDANIEHRLMRKQLHAT